jgi:hypothetical protein
MGLRTFGSSIRLNDYKDELLALRYLGDDVDVQTEYGIITTARAEVIQFTKVNDVLTAIRLGNTLVFQKAIQNEIRGSADWSVGTFEEIPHPTDTAPDGTMYQLTKPDEDVEALGAAMVAAGIDV